MARPRKDAPNVQASTPRLSLYMTPELQRVTKLVADQRGVSMSELLRILVMEAYENSKEEKKSLYSFWGMFGLDGNLRPNGTIPANTDELHGQMLVSLEELTRKHREWRFYVMQAEDARLQGKSLLRLLVETDRIHYDASFSAETLAQMSVDEKYRVALSYVQQAHTPPD